MKSLVFSLLVLGATPGSGAGLSPAYESGFTALQRGQLDEARLLLTQATQQDPSLVAAWWELGWTCWRLQDHACTVSSWERVQQLQPSHPELASWLPAARARQQAAAAEVSAAPVSLQPEGPTVRIVAAGDTMMGSELREGPAGLPPGNGEGLFEGLQASFRGADMAFLNLEGPLADGLPSTKCAPGSSDCYAFRTPTRYAAALQALGVDAVSLANNHALDLGPAGQEATMAALDAAGIAHAGRFGDLAQLQVGELSVAVVAAATSSCCLDVNQVEEVARAVALADTQADLVVLSFHGGAEGSAARHVPGQLERAYGERRGDVKALARAAVDAGADLVLGHGPHVLRAMEVYRGRLVAYSLGNLCGYRQFGTRGGPTGTSLLLEVELATNGALASARLHPLALDELGRPRPDPTGLGLQHVRELSAADFPSTGVRVGEDGLLSWED